MKVLYSWLVLVGCLGFIGCPPVTEKAPTDSEKVDEEIDLPDGLSYQRYLREVVKVLESDDGFRQRLENASLDEIKAAKLSYEKYLKEVMSVLMTDEQFAKKMMETKDLHSESGQIAQQLEFVSHGVRTKLDEIKRKEVDRLRQLMRLKEKLTNGMKIAMSPLAAAAHGLGDIPQLNMHNEKEALLGHMDHKNPNTFEIADLTKLIVKATKDLEDLDKERKKEFKEYEMEKEHERREKLSKMDESHRKAEEEEHEKMVKKHKDHPKLHHPGGKDQLQDVWEEKDGMDREDFDAKTFFHMHDTNGDHYWDETEIEALFEIELSKMYNEANPEDDMAEKYEEMSRMREHVMNELDKNKDKLVSLDEFVGSTLAEDFGVDEGWEGLDDQDVFTDEEMEEYERMLREEEERNRVVDPSFGQQEGAEHMEQQPIVHDNQEQQQQVGQGDVPAVPQFKEPPHPNVPEKL